MPRNSYTEDEVILCTYAALYDQEEFGGIDTIHRLTNRSISSIKMKIQNIAAILDEENIPRNPRISPLSGMPPGEAGRRTHWDIVESLTKTSRETLQGLCRKIVAKI
jgi:hypothetical protein